MEFERIVGVKRGKNQFRSSFRHNGITSYRQFIFPHNSVQPFQNRRRFQTLSRLQRLCNRHNAYLRRVLSLIQWDGMHGLAIPK